MSSPDPNRPNSQPEERHLHREDGRTDEEYYASLAKSDRQLMQGTVEVRAVGSRDLFESTFNLHLELLGLRPPLREPNFDAPTRRDFVNCCSPKNLPRIKSIKRDPKGGKLRVELVSDIHGTGQAVNIAPLIQNRYEARRNTPREFVNDTRIEINDFPVVTYLSTSKHGVPPVPRRFYEKEGMELKSCNVMVTEIVNPGQFYVEYIPDEEEFPMAGNTELQKFYDNKENCYLYQLRGGKPNMRNYYVCRFSSPGQWELCCVTKVNIYIRTCTIFVFNFEIFLDHVDFDDLLEYNLELFVQPARALQCALTDVVPPNMSPDWVAHSIEGFRNIVQAKVLHCTVVSREDEEMACGYPYIRQKLQVILLEKEATESVNLKLVCSSLAGSVGASANKGYISCRHPNHPNGKCTTITKKPKRIIIPCHILRQLEQNAIRETSSSHSQPNGKGQALPFPQTPALNVSINVAEDFPLFYAYWHRNRALIEGFRQNAPPSVQDKCKIVRIAGCASPGCIYVQDANKLENLYEMTKKLSVQAENNLPYPYDLMSEGNFVAVQIKVDATWYYRGIIKTVFSYEVVEVVLVDIGITIGVPPSSIRVLPTEYVKVPGFASRVYLDEPLVPDLTNWPATTKNATDVFINKHNSQDWLYYFHATQDEVLTFKEYEQEVKFDHEKQCWQAGSRKRARKEEQMNSLREHALIRKLYSAVGGHILCQNKQKKSHPVDKLTLGQGVSKHVRHRKTSNSNIV